MKKVSMFIQGEGRGHLSQALTVLSYLGTEDDISIQRVHYGVSFFGRSGLKSELPDQISTISFFSPNFLRTPDKKGIHIFLSILVNALLSPLYLFEIIRNGIILLSDKPDIILNFYDPVGRISSNWFSRRSERIAISHHFYLSHPDFIHPHGYEKAYFWLQLLNRIMMKGNTRLLALSFRKGNTHGRTEVVPPLVAPGLLKAKREQSGRDLVYLLNPGLLQELVDYYKRNSDHSADIFCPIITVDPLPENVKLYEPSRKVFKQKLTGAERIITTAGFDLAAEAFCLNIPVFLIPTENHYEQYCNALDASRTGMAYQLDSLHELEEVKFEPAKNTKYLDWVRNAQWKKILIEQTSH